MAGGSALWRRKPVGGHRLDAPHISGCIQFKPKQPKVVTFRNRDAIHNPGGDVKVGRKSLQLNSTADPDRMIEAGGAPTQVYEDYFALFGERMRRVEAVQSNRNGTRNSSAVPLRSFLH